MHGSKRTADVATHTSQRQKHLCPGMATHTPIPAIGNNTRMAVNVLRMWPPTHPNDINICAQVWLPTHQ